MFISKFSAIFSLVLLSIMISLVNPHSAVTGEIENDQIEFPKTTIAAASGATIRFKPMNGIMSDAKLIEGRQIPHLVLRRNGMITAPEERTLLVEVSGIETPPSGMTVTLSITTQHVDPDQPKELATRLKVWSLSQTITHQNSKPQAIDTISFHYKFDDEILINGEPIKTPTDYYRYDLSVIDAQDPTNILYRSSQEDAFLLENQWITSLPEVMESKPGAAPDELIVYYLDMFPFRKDLQNGTNWLSREMVTGYIQNELVPAMVEAFQTQTNAWEFSWYPEWAAYRGGEDQERISVALADGETWFHGQAAGQGNLGMFINISQGKIEYDTLTDGLMSTFHHELFHNHQRNIQQHYGGSGQVGGKDEAWNFFAEGIAVLASSVGQPEVQFSQSWGSRAYRQNATGFLGREGISGGDLNKSYTRLNSYHAAAYWRFLYEQCGGMLKSRENPPGGMQVIRLVLESLYSGEIVDIDSSKELVKFLPEIMDHALEAATCPFDTYQESLVAFARSIYALRLDGGRCVEPGIPEGCGFYDPEKLYYNPSISKIAYTGASTTAEVIYKDEIPNSFGIDMLELDFDKSANEQALQIDIVTNGDSGAVFDVQFVTLSSQPEAAQQEKFEVFSRSSSEAGYTYIIPESNMDIDYRLAVIITRVDTNESVNSQGGYTVMLAPKAE